MPANTGDDILDFFIDGAQHAADTFMNRSEPSMSEAYVTIIMLQQSFTALQMKHTEVRNELVDWRMKYQSTQ